VECIELCGLNKEEIYRVSASINEAAKAHTPPPHPHPTPRRRHRGKASLDLLPSFIKQSPLVGHHNFLFVKTFSRTQPLSGVHTLIRQIRQRPPVRRIVVGQAE